MLILKALFGLLPFLDAGSALSLVSLEEDAVGLVQRYFLAANASFNTSSQGEGEDPKKKKGKKKRKKVRKLPAYKAWLKEKGRKTAEEGDATKPLYLFLVRRFLDSVDKKKKHTKWKEESIFRWTIGSIIFCDEVTESLCKSKHSGFMKTNAIPMLSEFGEALRTRKFNGDVLITSHSGISPRHLAVGMEGNGTGVYKSAKFIADNYLKPIMENPNTVVQRIVSLGCNSGTRFNYKMARKEIKAKGKLTKATRQKLKTGVSFVDKLLKYVAEWAAEGMNGGIVPDMYGANGYTFNAYGMGRTEQRIHTVYDEESKTECMIQAVWKNMGAGKDQKGGCLNLDYTMMKANPMHWSYMSPNIDKFGYPNGDPLPSIPAYPEDAEVAGFLKARLYNEDTEGPTDGPQNYDGEGGPRADDLEQLSNLRDVSDESGAEDDGCEEDEDGCDEDDQDPNDEDEDEDDDEDGDDGDDDDEDPDSSMLQLGADRVAKGRGDSEPAQLRKDVGSSNTSTRVEELNKEVRARLNVTALDAKLQGGLEAFSEQQKVGVFNLMTRVMQDSNLSFVEKRSKLLQEIVQSQLPMIDAGMMKKWFLDMLMGEESKGKELPCLQQKLHLPLAMFEAVMALISAFKCDASLMCAADATEILAAVGQTAAHFHYADAACSVAMKPDLFCQGSLEQIFGSLLGVTSTSMALANQCDEAKKDEIAGVCGVHASFAGGWGILATLILVKMGVQPSMMQDHAIDMVYASSMFSKMIMETVTICSELKDVSCGVEVAKFLAFLGSAGEGSKKMKENCPDLDEMCDDPEVNPDLQDNDEDGLIDSLDPNDDNDGLADADPEEDDTDGDGIDNIADPDIDNDGRLNAVDQPGMQWWRELVCNAGFLKGQSPLESLMSPPDLDKTIQGSIPEASAVTGTETGSFFRNLFKGPQKMMEQIEKGVSAPPLPMSGADSDPMSVVNTATGGQ